MEAQTQTPAATEATEITLENRETVWTMYTYDGCVHVFPGPDPFTAYKRSNFGIAHPHMLDHIARCTEGPGIRLVYDESTRAWHSPKNVSSEVKYINHSPSNPQKDTTFARVQLGRRVADLYLAAQHINLDASNAACDLMQKLGALERFGFNQVMAKTEYNVRAETPNEGVNNDR